MLSTVRHESFQGERILARFSLKGSMGAPDGGPCLAHRPRMGGQDAEIGCC